MDEITNRMKSDINDWKQSLGYMSDENILMKTRLSQMLQAKFDNNLLPQVENLYTNLLSEEAFLNLLRHNIGELDNLIESEHSRLVNKNRFENMYATLQSQMTTVKIRLTHLKSEFNEFFQQEEDLPHFGTE